MPINYDYTLQQINTQFFSALDDYKKYYVLHNKNPTDESLSQAFIQAQNTLNSLTLNVYSIEKNIQANLNKLNKSIDDISSEIDDEKTANEELNKKLEGIKETQSTSSIMNHNYKQVYRVQYINNVAILIGVLISIRLMFKIYSTSATIK